MHPVEIQIREAQPSLGDGYESRCLPDWIASLCKRWERGEGVQYDRNTMGNLLHTLIAAKIRNERMAAEIKAFRMALQEAGAIESTLLAEVERLQGEKAQLLDALRELYDFSEPAISVKYQDRSVRAYEKAAAVLRKLEEQ